MPSTRQRSFPRIYILRASAARRAVVFVKHRQHRWSIHLWNLDNQRVDVGAVFAGRLYPRRCDISPDARYLLYLAAIRSNNPEWPDEYVGLSRTPWLTCLLAWKEYGTWSRGMYFSSRSFGPPEIGDRSYLIYGAESADRCPWNIKQTDPLQFAAERRIGFVEIKGSPARDPNDVWDEKRRAVVAKRRPGGGHEELRVMLSPYGEGEVRIGGYQNLYALAREDGEVALPAYCWLDWLDGEQVYGATTDGRLIVCSLRAGELVETWTHAFERIPTRRPSPQWARSF